MESGVILMSASPEHMPVSTAGVQPGPAPPGAGGELRQAATAEHDQSQCPYCGETSRHQVRRYRFCGHGEPAHACWLLTETTSPVRYDA